MYNTMWRATRTAKKAVPLITCLAKNNFARAAHFFVYFFAGVLHDHNVKLRSYTFYKGNVVCISVRFFSLPLFFTLVAARILHFLTAAINFLCLSFNECRLFF